jgi:hypothetical protein
MHRAQNSYAEFIRSWAISAMASLSIQAAIPAVAKNTTVDLSIVFSGKKLFS